MVLLALAALVLGVAWGSFGPAGTPLDLISDNSDLILYALMFFVGISIGLNKTILQKIREYHIKVFIIPFGIVVGSVAAGVVCGLLTGVGARNGAAIVTVAEWDNYGKQRQFPADMPQRNGLLCYQYVQLMMVMRN